jgi:hypothetical protein
LLFDDNEDRTSVLVMSRRPIGERAMTSTERSRRHRARGCDSIVACRFTVAVRRAIERAAERERCSLSDIVRRALRVAGVIDEAGNVQ